jgi:RES domain-containing protein
MEVYRITLAQYADQLYASGKAARWNSEGKKVIYTAASRSLACLENVVHRSGRGLNTLYKIMVVYVPDALYIETLDPAKLTHQWWERTESSTCRNLGDNWLQNQSSGVLKVPSAIINDEYNYLMNPYHSDFSKVKLISLEDFRFDPRIKSK